MKRRKEFEELPSVRGRNVTDFGNPTKIPINKYKRFLLEEDLEITEMDPIALIGQNRHRKFSCFDILKNYFHAAMVASRLTKCVYEVLPDLALEAAKKLEEDREKVGNGLPMFGLPISLKEMIPLNGHSVTHGSLCYIDRVVYYNADIVNILLQSGAIPFVRTTNPQVWMMLECESFTQGRTVNPYNGSLSCGGSSGGEGAINGVGASALGLGSDIGGSIRCPAAFNGIYGMRTTVGRLPTANYFSCQMGSESILSVTGPLNRSLETLELLMKTVVEAKPWFVDPSLVPIEWRKKQPQKSYRIGIMKSGGVVTPHPPIWRALDIVREKLEKRENVEVFEYKPFEHASCWKIISTLYFEDGGADSIGTMKCTGEPMCPQNEWV